VPSLPNVGIVASGSIKKEFQGFQAFQAFVSLQVIPFSKNSKPSYRYKWFNLLRVLRVPSLPNVGIVASGSIKKEFQGFQAFVSLQVVPLSKNS
jgi:hypothetical protein